MLQDADARALYGNSHRPLALYGRYACPCYKTLTRGPVDGKPSGGHVFTMGLKTKQSANKWILAGVAAIMDVES